MTERLYYYDSYLAAFRARIVGRAAEPLRLYLDRTAFYPESGGQPYDLGQIADVPVVEVIDEGDRIAHVVAAPVEAGEAECLIDWPRRFEYMQQHSGQHLLSAVFESLYGIRTVSVHFGSDSATIDLETPALTAAQIAAAGERANALVFENRPISVAFEDAADASGLRKPAERGGVLRIVSIDGLGRSACGGTHVRATGEIGPILIRRLDKIRGNVRVEFLCGGRAVRRARADYYLLVRAARTFSAPIDELPALVAAQTERLQESEKIRRRQAAELAARKGRELYEAAVPDERGFRQCLQRIPEGVIDEELRAVALGFAAGTKAVFAAAIEAPPSILLAVSADSGLHAGNLLKQALTAGIGRGGGSTQVAQGSLPSREALVQVLRSLTVFGLPAQE